MFKREFNKNNLRVLNKVFNVKISSSDEMIKYIKDNKLEDKAFDIMFDYIINDYYDLYFMLTTFKFSHELFFNKENQKKISKFNKTNSHTTNIWLIIIDSQNLKDDEIWKLRTKVNTYWYNLVKCCSVEFLMKHIEAIVKYYTSKPSLTDYFFYLTLSFKQMGFYGSQELRKKYYDMVRKYYDITKVDKYLPRI